MFIRLEFLDSLDSKLDGHQHEPSEGERGPGMQVPDSSLFKDLHAGVSLPSPRLMEYLSLFNKSFDSKCKDLYKERYVNVTISS